VFGFADEKLQLKEFHFDGRAEEFFSSRHKGLIEARETLRTISKNSPSKGIEYEQLSNCHAEARMRRLEGFRVQGSAFRVQGSGFKVQGSGFRVKRLPHHPFSGVP
jgi:hypothetical protein